MYGAEVWGCEDNELVDKLQLKFLRLLLNVKSGTSKCMTYAEMGKVQLQCLIDQRIASYWGRIITTDNHRFNKKLYLLTYQLERHNRIEPNWIKRVKIVLNNCGLYNHWLTQDVGNLKHFKNTVRTKVAEYYGEQLIADIEANAKCFNYRIFKRKLCFEKYLSSLHSYIHFTRFHVSNHKLPIQNGRFHDTPHNERLQCL